MTPAGAAPADSPATPAAPAAAGLGRRWCALVYDAFLLFALFLVAGFAVLPIIGPAHSGPAYEARQLYVLPAASGAFLFFYYLAIGGVYCIAFWSDGRRTLAMKTWGLGLRTAQGGPVDRRHAIVRYFAAWLGPAAGLAGYALLGRWGLLAGGLNYCWAWLDRDRQFLHDRLAGTRIIRL